MNIDEIRWNDEARTKIIEDSDRVLREAVIEISRSQPSDADEAFQRLNARLKTQFIDYEPGPDIRKYAEQMVGGGIEAS